MKKYSCVFLALAMFLGLAVQAQATSYDPTNLVQPQNVLRVNQGGRGDALIGEWYRCTVGTTFDGELANGDFLTYVSIENTSNDWVAAHVRLRTGRFSIEAIDFPILLSPRDVFWFQFLPEGTNGTLTGVKIWSADTKTVINSGLSSTGVWEYKLTTAILDAFTKLDDEYKKVEELAIGYIEVIGLWKARYDDAPANPMPEAALAGVTFQQLQTAFYNNGAAGGRYRLETTSTVPRFVRALDCGNVLNGQVYMGIFDQGLYTGYAMTALADFRTPNFLHRDDANRRVILGSTSAPVDSGPIIYSPLGANNSGRQDPLYTEPDWATNFGPTWNDGDDVTGGSAALPAALALVGTFSLDEVDDALAKGRVSSTYFNGGFSEPRSTFTMATITFPTKYLHSNFTYRTDPVNPLQVWPVGNLAQAASVRSMLNIEETVGKVSLYGTIYGLDEERPSNVVSPILLTNLLWEVNCVPVGMASRDKLEPFCFLTHEAGPIDVVEQVINGKPVFYAGWFELLGFGLMSGDANLDPRSGADPAYQRAILPLLNCLSLVPTRGFGYDRLIPAVVQMLDFEFKGNFHARSFVPSFTNPNICPTAPVLPVGVVPAQNVDLDF